MMSPVRLLVSPCRTFASKAGESLSNEILNVLEQQKKLLESIDSRLQNMEKHGKGLVAPKANRTNTRPVKFVEGTWAFTNPSTGHLKKYGETSADGITLHGKLFPYGEFPTMRSVWDVETAKEEVETIKKVAAVPPTVSKKNIPTKKSSANKENSPETGAAMTNCPDTSSGNTGKITTTTKKKGKFYAVAAGRKPGIYSTWQECEPQVKGFSGAKVKSFKTNDEAVAFIKGGFRKKKKKTQNKKNKPKAGKGPLAPLQPGMPRPFAKCTNTPYTMYASFH